MNNFEKQPYEVGITSEDTLFFFFVSGLGWDKVEAFVASDMKFLFEEPAYMQEVEGNTVLNFDKENRVKLKLTLKGTSSYDKTSRESLLENCGFTYEKQGGEQTDWQWKTFL